MSVQVALLRGVNLGKRKVVMSELRALAEGAGFKSVRTLLASGNLVLDAKQKGAALERKLEALLREAFGFKIDVFVRDSADLDAIIAANPFRPFAHTAPARLAVNFMRAPASKAEMAAMDASRAREEIKQGLNCLYLKFPDGQGPSKLKLPRLGTARNWNTVTKLAAMARGE